MNLRVREKTTNKEIKMKLTNAIKKLKKAGYEISNNTGSYVAELNGAFISFFENGTGSGQCSKFTYDSQVSCSPTYGLSLKQAMG